MESCRKRSLDPFDSAQGKTFTRDDNAKIGGNGETFDHLAQDDYRRQSPRFQGRNFQRNLDLVERAGEIAREKKCTPAQLALAWMMAQGEDIVPTSRTKRRKYLQENAGALNVSLTSEDLARIDEGAPRDAFAGLRYPQSTMEAVNR